MFGLGKYGQGIGLHRALRYYDFLNLPPTYFAERSVVVTGSNGKGSTTRFLYTLLRTQFERVGCFISPHLLDVRERFELNGALIPQADFERHKENVLRFNAHHLPEGDTMGAFELLFDVALAWFAEQEADCIVWEAGIGGRYDPTRMLFAPLSALTSLDLEHTELLGGTLELIAYDKLDVTGVGGESVISASVPPHMTERLKAYARVTGKTFHFVAEDTRIQDEGIIEGRQNATLIYGENRLPLSLPLMGAHQIENAATAIQTARRFLHRHGRALPDAVIAPALAGVTWPGRLERISTHPDIWIDVGHTPDAVRRVLDTLLSMYPRERLIAVYGVSANKDSDAITRLIEAHFETVILTQAYKNGTPVERLAGKFAQPDKIAAQFPRIEDAVAYATRSAAESGRTVAVLGGLFLAVEFKVALAGGNPAGLEFF